MLENFINHVDCNLSFLHKKKLFVAVSGGVDSMVLLKLLQQVGMEIAVLHCNFNLRNDESDGDQDFIKKYCQTHNIAFFETNFPAKNYAETNKLSIQVAARKLRYDWFYDMLSLHFYDYVLTAHHLDDCLETFLINLSRGTGLDGLLAIPVLNGKVVRPLLPFSRNQITAYAADNQVEWREDSSNESDHYLRNKIRHKIVPELKSLNDNFLNNFRQTQHFLFDKNLLAIDAIANAYRLVVQEKTNLLYINIDILLQFENHKQYLYQWLKIYNFKAWIDIYALLSAENGKKIFSNSHQIIKQNNFLVLSNLQIHDDFFEYDIPIDCEFVKFPVKLSISKATHISTNGLNTIFVDGDLISFPLNLRKPKETDIFYPKGMVGSLKISKFIRNLKLEPFERQNVWVLVDASEQLVWVINHRQDQRFLATNNTKKIIKLVFEQ